MASAAASKARAPRAGARTSSRHGGRAAARRAEAPAAAQARASSEPPPSLGRRAALLAASGALLCPPLPRPAAAAEGDVDVYFGCGCFWHVQHEFVVAEQRILGRGVEQVTALAGYAGGKQTLPVSGFDTVCYHTLGVPGFQSEASAADYGRLGHGEVVGMRVPASSVGDFAREYFSLLDKNGDRPDVMDRGGEYRNLVGLPGGVDGPLFGALQAAAPPYLRLAAASGNEGDTLGRKTVWVYDSAAFPFHQAEVYHQYHDGFFPGENYPESYNGLKKEAVAAGRLGGTGCPDEVRLSPDKQTWRFA